MFWSHTEAIKYIKSLLTVFALGVAWMGGGDSGSSQWLIQLGIMVGGYIIGVVGVAAVVRRDVTELLKWKVSQEQIWREHNAIHNDVTELLGEMKAMNQSTKERIDRLDDRLERRQRPRI